MLSRKSLFGGHGARFSVLLDHRVAGAFGAEAPLRPAWGLSPRFGHGGGCTNRRQNPSHRLMHPPRGQFRLGFLLQTWAIDDH